MGEGCKLTKNSIVKDKKIIEKKSCLKCQKLKPYPDYYISYSKLHTDRKVPVCKVCLSEMFDYNNPIESLKDILRQIDKPYIQFLYNTSAIENPENIFGKYMKNVGMLQYKGLTFKNSNFDKLQNKENSNPISEINSSRFVDTFRFNVTEEMIRRWGSKYEDDNDYMALEDFYHSMKKSNKIETHQEETYLKKLASISLQMDKELNDGNTGQVKQLGDLFSKFMADSKFRAMDKTDADKTGGIRNFSTIFSEVEKDGHIPPWEYYKKLKNINQDIVDKTIMHIENFTLRLNKIERMVEPPDDTPKLNNDEYERVDSE